MYIGTKLLPLHFIMILYDLMSTITNSQSTTIQSSLNKNVDNHDESKILDLRFFNFFSKILIK
jgi:hypothetical protein